MLSEVLTLAISKYLCRQTCRQNVLSSLLLIAISHFSATPCTTFTSSFITSGLQVLAGQKPTPLLIHISAFSSAIITSTSVFWTTHSSTNPKRLILHETIKWLFNQSLSWLKRLYENVTLDFQNYCLWKLLWEVCLPVLHDMCCKKNM